ncbi:MAG: metal ABC transporter substrate-binding protein [Bacteroidia bacterium]|nr:metal ABC transporter substrate-binding protein [Bacteroidia bacterium]
MKHALPLSTILLVLLLSAGCADRREDDARPLVVVSIQPLAHWVDAVGGDALRVITLLPSNANPHTFELLPRQIEDASDARLLLTIGAGLEPWADKLAQNMKSDSTLRLVLSDGEQLLQDAHEHHHGHDHGHVHAFGNPHLWLDPLFAVRSVEKIRDALGRLYPQNAQRFRERAAHYIDSLRQLHADIEAVTTTWTQRRFIADHSSWVYFAERYGLREAGAIEQQPGREISARELAGLIRMMRASGIRAIFADKRSNARGVTLLAEESGARIAFLDPLGGALTSASYLTLMRENLAAMDGVMR